MMLNTKGKTKAECLVSADYWLVKALAYEQDPTKVAQMPKALDAACAYENGAWDSRS